MSDCRSKQKLYLNLLLIGTFHEEVFPVPYFTFLVSLVIHGFFSCSVFCTPSFSSYFLRFSVGPARDPFKLTPVSLCHTSQLVSTTFPSFYFVSFCFLFEFGRPTLLQLRVYNTIFHILCYIIEHFPSVEINCSLYLPFPSLEFPHAASSPFLGTYSKKAPASCHIEYLNLRFVQILLLPFSLVF